MLIQALKFVYLNENIEIKITRVDVISNDATTFVYYHSLKSSVLVLKFFL
jgi:hypothetical protein